MPFYVAIVWGQQPPQPLEAIHLNDMLQGPNAPVPVPFFPDCYCVASREQAMMLIGAITCQFAGVRTFVWNVPGHLVSYIR